MSIIEASGVTCGYGKRLVIDNASFRAGEGVTMLLGRNGCGKSTLIKALAGLIRFSGRVLVNGADISRTSRRGIAKLISYLPQRQTIPPFVTVMEYAAMGANPEAGLFSAPGNDAAARAMEELEILGAAALAGRNMATLSGGEARIAALARARVQRSAVMIMDEPLAGLDYGRQHEFLELVAGSDRPVFMSLHDPVLAWQYASRILIMENGRVFEYGSDEIEFERALKRVYGEKIGFETAGGARMPVWHSR